MRPRSRFSKASKNILESTKVEEDGDKPLFFFKPNEAYGEFCQWYPCTLTVSKTDMSSLIGHSVDEDDPEGWQPIYFNCAEQFMMYCKAGRFHDSETQRLVLATHDAKEQKRLARLTKGFDAASWDEIKSEVVVAGNMAKFGQNPHLKRILLDTGDRVLAEAASTDRVWGIGFTAQEAMTHSDQQRWGENRLGKALMQVRGRLRQMQDNGP
ncbi:hypothetical protein S7711_09913 [Stachybotrys chartarum IBT 7711]|uniref:NADAR domain-containing protein n=1 Tax=Stachybotrys chartarum (strain CBS 109288 / IBT 7711) TaxID=1280523 RepID=A0A084AG02_STACB|nr:hypothetical protein S7711_09913 [Stachybotrys chartarum IBT 7711]KFA50704.1 hypothetical protein S40293_07854 [Stachybotrys chartarum IBT 40293]